jgi:hypothetical protein
MRFDLPSASIVDASGNVNQQWLFTFTRWNDMLNDMTDEGATTDRPTSRLYVGRPYIDRTLNKQIWFSALPDVWRDAMGNIV